MFCLEWLTRLVRQILDYFISLSLSAGVKVSKLYDRVTDFRNLTMQHFLLYCPSLFFGRRRSRYEMQYDGVCNVSRVLVLCFICCFILFLGLTLLPSTIYAVGFALLPYMEIAFVQYMPDTYLGKKTDTESRGTGCKSPSRFAFAY